jgi:beta-lactamase superfamily II metal-dependent hydrolase
VNLRDAVAAGLAAVVAASAAWALASRPDGLLHVTVLATGSSPAVLVQAADGSRILVDGGSAPALLLAALGRALPPGASHLGLLVLTGGEEAAVKGLGGLPGRYTVGTVVIPGPMNPGANDIVAALESSGATVLEAGSDAWSYGGATWRCLGFIALATARGMCALTVADATGRLLVVGDAGTADQEALCAVYGGALEADLVVAPPGGAISPVLLATVRPDAIAVPLAQGVPASAAPVGYPTDRTSVDGDLHYIGGSEGLQEST